MGIFSKFKSLVFQKPAIKKPTVLTNIARIGLIPSTVIGNIIGRTLKAVGLVKSFTPQKAKDLSKTQIGATLGTAIVGVGVTADIFAGLPVTRSIITKVLPKTVPTSVIGATAGLVTLGAVSVSPVFTEVILDLPSTLIKGGKKLGEVVEELPIEETEGKTPSGLLLGVAGGLITGKIIDEVLDNRPPKTPPEDTKKDEVPITPTPPITPETVSLEDTKETPAIKKPKEARRQTIKQEVNITFKPKRYLNVVQVN